MMMKKGLVLFISFLLAFCQAGVCPGLGEGEGAETILVISDTHLTREARNHADMMAAVLQAAQGRDAVLLLGDNTNNSRPEEHALVLQWARTLERETGAKVFILPGNHDYSDPIGPEAFRTEYGAFGREQAFSLDADTASCAVMTEKGTCLLLLDTNRTDGSRLALPDGGIAEGTLKWVQEVLEALPEGTPVIACGHHPILPAERDERTPGAEALSRVLQSCGAGLYFCGHDHGFSTVREDSLQQVTVGQPQAYPGWVGIVEREGDGFDWHTEPIYDARSSAYLTLRENARTLGRTIAEGTLAGTPYAGDPGAVEWFVTAFMAAAGGELTPEISAALLANENCRKWREIETTTVVKKWILGMLENCPEDVRHIHISPSGKPAVKREQ